MLAKEISSRRPLAVKHLPLLARLYCEAYHRPTTLWRARARRVLFSLFYAFCRSSTGEFEYDRLGRRRTVRFNARNLQFQALYAPFFRYGYEPEVAMLVDALVKEGGTFFDIGSNWGYFPLYAASNHEKLTVHAFEPTPGTYRDLTACVEQAGISEMVTCHPVALSAADGEAYMNIPDGLHSGQAMVSTEDGTARIAMRRLDAMNLPAPDFIKMDVEDHEMEVLQGAAETLRSRRPFIVFENKPNPTSPERTLEPLFFLAQLGYRLYVPAVRRKSADQQYYLPAGGHSLNERETWVLMPLEANARLFWQQDLNVFACHESRLPQLASMFNA
jgi:FkbM family methyltransferase